MTAKLKSITIKEGNWLCTLPAFPVGHTISFDPRITWIVGENGCGKSSLLNLLMQSGENKRKEKPTGFSIEMHPPNEKTTIRFFDTEKMNPRVSERCESMYAVAVIMTRASHGQVLFPIIEAIRSDPTLCNCVSLVDEPEAGISPWNQKKLITSFEAATREKGIQLIVATHSIIFMQSGLGSVLDLNQSPARLIPSNEFKAFGK